MKIYGYGEDALTLWAMKYKLEDILDKLGDKSDAEKCTVFYRPSFGRGGGAKFGEPDFLLLTNKCLYIGESKWMNPNSKNIDDYFIIKKEQNTRNVFIKNYVDKWLAGNYVDWDEFRESNPIMPGPDNTTKPVPAKDTTLAKSLFSVLKMVKQKNMENPKPQDIMLFFHLLPEDTPIPDRTDCGWDIVTINYSKAFRDNFVLIEE